MTNPLCRLAVLISGSGSNLEAILQASETNQLGGAKTVVVISSRAEAFGLERARRHGVKALAIDPKDFATDAAFQLSLLETIRRDQVDVVCLAGYLKKLSPEIIAAYRNRILNIHPALLPKFGGAGMYGHFVHEAVLKAGETESGCSVHLVDEEFDHGTVLAQARVPVVPGETAEQLAARILQLEHRLYPETIRAFCQKWQSARKVTS